MAMTRRRRLDFVMDILVVPLLVLSLWPCQQFLCKADNTRTDGRVKNDSNNNNNNNMNTTIYDWEDWDYYTILGLEPRSMHTYDTKTIRKAYRKQAQMWHPDKLIHHHQQQQQANITRSSNAASSSETLTSNKQKGKKTISVTTIIPSKEECNARFARIAEAYQVLSDDEQRQQYDEYLEFELSSRAATRNENRFKGEPLWSFSWDAFQNLDPLRMFEEFFGFNQEVEEADEDDDPYFRFHSAFDHNQQQQQQQQDSQQKHTHHHTKPPPSWFTAPDRVREERQVRIDPYSGREILRILQHEDYFDYNGYYYFYNNNNNNEDISVYTRILAQDFVDEWDSYKHAWVYLPLQSEPTIVKEGYRSSPDNDSSLYAEQQQLDPSILWPGTMLVSGSTMRNKWGYELQLGSSCELSIVYRLVGDTVGDGEEYKDEVVWSSRTELAQSQFAVDNDCRLQLRGSHLVLTSGNPEQLLWYSPSLYNDNESMFVSRLDADGSLAVYRLETVAFETPWLANLWDNTMLIPQYDEPSILTVLFPTCLRRTLWSILVFGGEPLWHLSPTHVVHGVCESATGSPFGCLRLGRKLLQVYRFGKHLILLLVAILDHVFEKL